MSNRRISVIPAKIDTNKNVQPKYKKLNVVAYCRVSTLQEEQESSYEAQIEYYKKLINENPNWHMAGIYADDGISATNTKKRDDFNAMIDRCIKKSNEIDMIITKSISRFARNTVDSLIHIRKLKEKNIAVYFEKENINTLDSSGELLITILSSQAQEESRNISENVRWGLKRKYETGETLVSRLLGYKRNKNGQLEIIPEEAEIVKFIFAEFMEGSSYNKIANKLKEKGYKTIRGKTNWGVASVIRILSNEKYIGDTLCQKTYTVDFLTKERRTNNGEVNQYYTENSHQGIIPRELFYRVQEEMERRANSKNKAPNKNETDRKCRYNSKYALTSIFICKECGTPYRRQVWSKYGEKKAVWRCENRLRNGTKYCKNSPTYDEKVLQKSIMNAINKQLQDKNKFIGNFKKNVISVISKDTTTEYDSEIKELEKQLVNLIKDNTYENTEEYEEACKDITNRIEELETNKIKALGGRDKLNNAQEFMDNTNIYMSEYDDTLVRRLIRNVFAVSDSKIEICFYNGVVEEENVSFIH